MGLCSMRLCWYGHIPEQCKNIMHIGLFHVEYTHTRASVQEGYGKSSIIAR